MDPGDLLVAPCTFDAAKYAVEHWHYSKSMPAGKLVKYGVWEHGAFVGVIIFSRGASPRMGLRMERRYGLAVTQWCELTRVAMTSHEVPVTQALAAAIRLLRDDNPGLRLLLSYADPGQGHRGAIYQAGNWLFTGRVVAKVDYWWQGRWRHDRVVKEAFPPEVYRKFPTRESGGKFRYLFPLDKGMRRVVAREALPYPPPLAGEGSTVSHRASGSEGRVRPPSPAPSDATVT